MNRECPIKEKNLKALEQMDKMMDEILVNDLSNMCPVFSFGTQHHKPPTSSRSDGHICRTDKYVMNVVVLLVVCLFFFLSYFSHIHLSYVWGSFYVKMLLFCFFVCVANKKEKSLSFFTETRRKAQIQLQAKRNYQTVKAFPIIKQKRINAVQDIKMVGIVYILMPATLFEHFIQHINYNYYY